jgi:glutamine amidotransferase
MKVVVVDTGSANLPSLQRAIQKVGYGSTVCSKPEDLERANKVFLPGVGAFDDVMLNIRSTNLDHGLREVFESGNCEILGICLGMQILGELSEEGSLVDGLGFFGGNSKRLKPQNQAKVPHIGFNTVKQTHESILLENLDSEVDFYFVHSYAMLPNEQVFTVGVTENGTEFTSVLESGNGIYGVQFHPEKSSNQGLHVIKNFLEA